MTETELRETIQRGPSGGFLFWGDEEYLMRHYLADLRAAVLADCPPGIEDFNRVVLTLEDGDFSAVESAILSLPVMAPKRIVEISPESMDRWREKERKAFLSALEALASSPDTVLVVVAARGTFDAGTAKRPSAFFRALTKVLAPVEFPLQSGARLHRWVQRHFQKEGIRVDSAVCAALLARCAPDMTCIAGEIEKLIGYVRAHGSDTVTVREVELVTSPGIREDAFALANAVLAGDRRAALAALDNCRRRRDDPAAVLATVTRVICDMLVVASMAEDGAEKAEIARTLKMHEYKASLYLRAACETGTRRLAAAVERCRRTDRLMKSIGSDYIPLERLICAIPEGAAARRAPEAGS